MIPCSMKGSFDAGRFITVVRNLNNTSKFKATVVHMSKERKQGSDKLLAIIVTIHVCKFSEATYWIFRYIT